MKIIRKSKFFIIKREAEYDAKNLKDFYKYTEICDICKIQFGKDFFQETHTCPICMKKLYNGTKKGEIGLKEETKSKSKAKANFQSPLAERGE